MSTPCRELSPPIESYRTGRLPVSHGHELSSEESGNPQGKPVVFLYGNPGGGTVGKQRRIGDPQINSPLPSPASSATRSCMADG